MADVAPDWVEAQATTHIWDWGINERRDVNVNDPEIKELIKAQILIVVDETSIHYLPPPAPAKTGGCGCGS